MGWIVIISGGPGGKGYITELAKQKARECEVLIGSMRQLEAVEPLPEQELIQETDIQRIMEVIDRNRHRRTGVIVTGDAGLYSLAQRIIDRFGREAVEEIIPGVSSLQVAFARLKEPWLNVQVFSYHGRAMEGLQDVLKHQKVAILCDREHNARVILRELVRYGLFKQSVRVYVCQELTLPEERIIEISSAEDIEGITPRRREIIIIIQGGKNDSN